MRRNMSQNIMFLHYKLLDGKEFWDLQLLVFYQCQCFIFKIQQLAKYITSMDDLEIKILIIINQDDPNHRLENALDAFHQMKYISNGW